MSSKPKAKREKKEDVSLMDVDHPTLIPSQPQNNPPKSPDASKKTAKPSNKAADTQKTHVRGSGRITKTYPATGSKAVGLEKEPKNKQRQVQEVPPPQQQQRQQPAEQITGPPTAPAVIRPGRQLAIDKLAAADANQIQLDRHVRRTLEDVAAGWYEAESFGGGSWLFFDTHIFISNLGFLSRDDHHNSTPLRCTELQVQNSTLILFPSSHTSNLNVK